MKLRPWLRSLLTVAAALPLVVALGTDDASAQFSPGGRKKPKGKPAATAPQKPSGTRPAKPKPEPSEKPAPPKTPPSGAGQPAGEAPEGATDNDALIQRYTGVALSQPGLEFPVRRLAELGRARDGNLDRLIADFEARAAQGGSGEFSVRVLLAGLYEQAGRRAEAKQSYERAAKLDPKSTVAELGLARLLEKDDPLAARAAYERALPRLSATERELVVRTLMKLALDAHDYDAATRYHAELVKAAKGSMYARAELGKELLLRGEAARAVTAFREVEKAAAGDNRALAPALRDLGSALLATGDTREAIAVLRRAASAASTQPGLLREIDELLVEAYRREGRLPELVAELEQRGDTSADRLRLLGRLYEETGNMERALAAYRRALQKNPGDVETRLKVVQLLELQGDLDAAVKEYDELVRKAPDDAALTQRFVELLLQRGERTRALSQLDRLERSARGDQDTLVVLIDFYERIGESDRAEKLLLRLSGQNVRDPSHLIELGSRHYRDGKRDEAKQTWRRILTVEPDRAKALVTLGEVYLDHDFTEEALASLREALRLKPDDVRVKRALAIALERTGSTATSEQERRARFDEATTTWESLLAGVAASNDGAARRSAQEARQHIVKLWQRMGQLKTRMSPLASKFAQTPPDVQAGQLLAQAQLLVRDYPGAEKTLRELVRIRPGDVSGLQALERVLALQEKRDASIEVLKKLVLADPSGAREYYQRMARYAAEDYQDARAIEYAAKAVELNPDDAQGHQRLAEMYRRRQQTDEAITSYRQAILKNDRLYPAYFALAELLLSKGKDEEADLWLRRVMRAAPDEELIARAARLSLELNLARGSVDRLESDLLPMALGQPQKPLYRRLLLEVYGAEAFPLIHRVETASTPEERKAAEAELSRLGERAVRPLLDSLGDERVELQRTALALLSRLRTRGASAALLAYAAGDAPEELRERAVLAAGAARDPRSLPKLEALVFGDAGGGNKGGNGGARSDSVAIAAAWAIARQAALGDGEREASALSERLTKTDVPEIAALGALGLSRREATRDQARAVQLLGQLADSSALGPLPRAAAAYSLGARIEGTTVDASLETKFLASLLALLDVSDRLTHDQALWALSSIDNPRVEGALAEGLVDADERARSVALAAALGRAPTGAKQPSPLAHPLERLPEGHVDVAELLTASLPTQTHKPPALALVRLARPLEEAAVLAVRTSPEKALIVAQALTARDGAPAFGALTVGLDQAPEALRSDAEKVARSITERTVPAFASLVHHDDARLRAASISVLGLAPNDETAQKLVADALRDPTPAGQNAAFEALGRGGHPAQSLALAKLLDGSPEWRERHRAALVLGDILSRSAKGEDERATATVIVSLDRAKRADSSRLVRDAAQRALSQASPPSERSFTPGPGKP